MGLDKEALKAAIMNGLRSAEPGQDSVEIIAAIWADGIDAFVRSGKAVTDSVGGGCAYGGAPHPPVHSEGSII